MQKIFILAALGALLSSPPAQAASYHNEEALSMLLITALMASAYGQLEPAARTPCGGTAAGPGTSIGHGYVDDCRQAGCIAGKPCGEKKEILVR